MKNVSPELIALYATREFMSADLITYQGGSLGSTVLRFTSGDSDVIANGNLYVAGRSTGPYWDRKDNKAKCHWKIGMEVDTLVIDCIPGSFKLFGIPFQQAVKLGYLDGSEMTLEKCPMPFGSYGPIAQQSGFLYGDTRRGTVRYFVGRVATVDFGRSVMTFSINSHLELLNLTLPRNLYQPTCVNNLGDTACGVILSSYAFNGTVASGSTAQSILTNSSPFAADSNNLFGHGKIVFTSGANEGLSMQIVGNAPGSPAALSLLYQMPNIPTAGDTFTAYYGCDKTLFTTVTGTGNFTSASNIVTAVTNITDLTMGQSLIANGTTYSIVGINITSDEVFLSQNAGFNGTGTAYSAPGNGCQKFLNTARYRAERLVPQPGSAV